MIAQDGLKSWTVGSPPSSVPPAACTHETKKKKTNLSDESEDVVAAGDCMAIHFHDRQVPKRRLLFHLWDELSTNKKCIYALWLESNKKLRDRTRVAGGPFRLTSAVKMKKLSNTKWDRNKYHYLRPFIRCYAIIVVVEVVNGKSDTRRLASRCERVKIRVSDLCNFWCAPVHCGKVNKWVGNVRHTESPGITVANGKTRPLWTSPLLQTQFTTRSREDNW